MKNGKRIPALLLFAVMLMTLLPPVPVHAQTVPGELESEERTLPELPEGFHFAGKTNLDKNGNPLFYLENEPGEYGLVIGLWVDAAGNPAADPDKPLAYEHDGLGAPVLAASGLPSSYDARDYGWITPVEEQIGGTCWAHSVIACLETNYIKKGLGTTADLSEYHTVWYGKNGYYPDVDDPANDGTTWKDPDGILALGGNTTDAAAALMNFSGAVKEADYPFTSTTEKGLYSEMKKTFTYDHKYEHAIVPDTEKVIPYSIPDIKQAILDCGAVWSLYYSGDSFYSAQYYTDSCAYYCPYAATPNHAITIIGWDDQYSRLNFGTNKPSGNGAWLVKNSWGEDWGENGYFWLSYEDKSIPLYDSEAFTVTDAADYADVYLYDGLGYYSVRSGGSAAANVFTARDDEYLTKVSCGAVTDRDYTLRIYTDLPENFSSPEDGTLAYMQSGTTGNERFIDLSGEVKIDKGETFAVVFEMNVFYTEGTDFEDEYQTHSFSSGAGQSFYRTSGGVWRDAVTAGYGNVCIRAAARSRTESKPYKVTFKDGAFHSETRETAGTSVTLPSAQGMTYTFTYNGKPFTGKNLQHSLTVETHCYPTAGTPKDGNGCVTEYRCVFCGKEMRPAEESHDFIRKTVSPTVSGIGYTEHTCRVCSETVTDTFTFFPGSKSGEWEGLLWQVANGRLTVWAQGASPELSSSDKAPWSAYSGDITALTVMEGTTRIGAYLFSGLNALASVGYPSTLTEIGEYCFNDCSSLTEGVIPGTVTSVGKYAFYSCSSLKKITVEEGVTYIPYLVWNNDALEEIALPSTLTGGQFMNYSHLDRYTVAPENKTYRSADGVLFTADMKTLVAYPATKSELYYDIPDTVTAVKSYAFSFVKKLQYLDMSCAIRTIPEKTFNQSASIRLIDLPDTLVKADKNSFYNLCVPALYLPAGVTNINSEAFVRSASPYVIPAFYTDSSSAAINTLAAQKGYTCTVTHTKHAYTDTVRDIPASCLPGEKITACVCGCFVYTYEQPNGVHSLDKGTVAPPTCTQEGYTASVCALCGETVLHSYQPAAGHSFTGAYLSGDGTHTRLCVNGCGLSGEEETCTFLLLHSEPGRDCRSVGTDRFECVCGAGYSAANDRVGEHIYRKGVCTVCGEQDPDYDPAQDCTCQCHSSNALIRFFWKIKIFFQKLFGLDANRICACGAAHW